MSKCGNCFRRVDSFEVQIMEDVRLEAHIHLTPKGRVEYWGKLNLECRQNEVKLHDGRFPPRSD